MKLNQSSGKLKLKQGTTGKTKQVSAVGKKKSPPSRGGLLGRLLMLAFLGLVVFASYEYASLPSAEPLLKQNPKTTALIEQRAEEARDADQKPRRRQSWVGLSNVSRHAIDAVLLSEDASFYLHEGVDTKELENALEDAVRKGKLGRGASTITQQLAKNLWLSTDRSLLRKGKELILAHRLEESLPKNRILTIYLNVVEWGNGVYGIEAAAREHFGIAASSLTAAQGAILASMLPAPRKRSVTSGSKALMKRAHWIIEQMEAVKRLNGEQAQLAHAEIDQLLSGKKAEEPEDEAEG
ncbi:monofunctional biosynthetic peptidoglycan transglycosylase [Vitiosangium sp. GDMCC 1.1324]|uniref:monofunctional biosynthetic peptidoglycan transglycosylase n=1 Tax=Vitiosangium sp. (strain GDMCC 1.1324) TaxID=2138576 RepID=UPI000D334076|nr:monofunctional biosynthetic peptidoglycan transglycosylase [Vitiosangium sp. GDMCC 1.1324]PTL85323.1 monofunctional biosynthetic peptidoglycan transglycosylase [Vitiosangium sp. GDMCC 1.1324]